MNIYIHVHISLTNEVCAKDKFNLKVTKCIYIKYLCYTLNVHIFVHICVHK